MSFPIFNSLGSTPKGLLHEEWPSLQPQSKSMQYSWSCSSDDSSSRKPDGFAAYSPPMNGPTQSDPNGASNQNRSSFDPVPKSSWSPTGGASEVGFDGIGSNFTNKDYHNDSRLYQDDLFSFLPPDVEEFSNDIRSYPSGYNGLVKHCESRLE